ncbi:MAG: metallophosphoesterase [Candidatus Micrarchaeota archaeon]
MKLLVIADIHEKGIVLERLRMHKKDDYDYILIAGDSANNSTSFITEVLDCFPDAYIIPGNNESDNALEILRKAPQYAHEKRFELKNENERGTRKYNKKYKKHNNYNIVGFGFSNPTPFHTPGEMSDEEIYIKLTKLDIDKRTILLVHAPPFGFLDEIKGNHIGSTAIRRIIEEKQPFLVFCGHLHEVMGVERLKKTLIINIPAAETLRCCVCEIKDDTVCIQFKEI